MYEASSVEEVLKSSETAPGWYWVSDDGNPWEPCHWDGDKLTNRKGRVTASHENAKVNRIAEPGAIVMPVFPTQGMIETLKAMGHDDPSKVWVEVMAAILDNPQE